MQVKSESEVAQSCLTLSDPMDCSLPGSSIHGIFQARILGWVAIVFSSFSSVDFIVKIEIKFKRLCHVPAGPCALDNYLLLLSLSSSLVKQEVVWSSWWCRLLSRASGRQQTCSAVVTAVVLETGPQGPEPHWVGTMPILLASTPQQHLGHCPPSVE